MKNKFFAITAQVCPKCKECLWTTMEQTPLSRRKNEKFLIVKKPRLFYCTHCSTHFDEYLQKMKIKKIKKI